MAEVIMAVLLAVLVAVTGLLAGVALTHVAHTGGKFRLPEPAPMQSRQVRSEEEEAVYIAELDEVMAGLAATAEREGIAVDPREIRRHARELLDTAYEHRGG